jgi:hypothetical protein
LFEVLAQLMMNNYTVYLRQAWKKPTDGQPCLSARGVHDWTYNNTKSTLAVHHSWALPVNWIF